MKLQLLIILLTLAIGYSIASTIIFRRETSRHADLIQLCQDERHARRHARYGEPNLPLLLLYFGACARYTNCSVNTNFIVNIK